MFMNNLSDFGLALKYHTLANKSITDTEFQRAVKISSGFELDPQIVEVIYKVFDENDDGQLSYKEFIAVLKDRVKRGIKVRLKMFKLFYFKISFHIIFVEYTRISIKKLSFSFV